MSIFRGSEDNNTLSGTVTKVAGEAFADPLRPVCVAPDGRVHLVTDDEGRVAAFLGLNKIAANIGQSIEVYLPYRRITGFSGLVTGAEYWAYNGNLVPYGLIPAGRWCRLIGIADTAASMVLTLGEAIRKPA